MLEGGGCCVLVPRFTAKSYARDIIKYKCNFIAGVPTLYEALLRLPSMDNADLSSLKGVFSGGDSLSIELKKKFDRFLADHKAAIQVREGYGTTETVTACCLTPRDRYKEGSIGLPFPDTYIKIVKPGTDEELPYGEEGEILLAGPTVMKGYMNNPEETADTLRTHADGLTWVYTGDLGIIDRHGNIFIKGRIKNMLLSGNGQNIYPEEIEDKLNNLPYVQECVVVQREGKLYGLVYPDPELVKKNGISIKELNETMEQNRKLLNAQIPAYEQIAGIILRDEEFEKTPKRSIKRFLYS
jgi:long-chain acyl-CoA synthetase